MSAVALSQRPPVIRAVTARRALQIRSMAGQSDVKLDKQTPDSKWKEILGADEVSGAPQRRITGVMTRFRPLTRNPHSCIKCALGVHAVSLAVPTHHLCVSYVQYHILRNKGTEPAGTGEYNKLYDDGTYKCGGCGAPLYK